MGHWVFNFTHISYEFRAECHAVEDCCRIHILKTSSTKLVICVVLSKSKRVDLCGLSFLKLCSLKFPTE